MTPAALHTIQPKGWLKEQIRLNAEGFFGHLTDISAFLTEENAWLKWWKTSEELARETGVPAANYQRFGWEEQPYWLRGAYRLALLNNDARLMAQCEPYFEAVLASRREDGYFGPECLRAIETNSVPVPDLWPHMIMADVLKDRYLACGDGRILSLLTAFFHYCLALPDEQFLPVDLQTYKTWYGRIQIERSCDMVPVIWWLYGLTRDEALPRLAQRFFGVWQSADAEKADRHVVTFAQRIRYQAQMYPLTKDPSDLEGSKRKYLQHMAQWGQMPGGLYAADENVREGKRDPRQATETCAMAEIVRSFTYLASLSEEAEWFDRIEDIMFNSFPASFTPDYSGLHYLTADNLPELDDQNHDYCNKGCMTRFSPFRYRCCQHNASSGWPNFVSSLFATEEEGIAVCAYAPCVFETALSGRRIRIEEETDYPFCETIRLKITSDAPFTLRLRVPGWVRNAAVLVNGLPAPDTENRWIRLCGIKSGDSVELRFPMEAHFRSFPDNGGFVCLDRGPLTYSLRLQEQWIPSGSKPDRAGRIWTEFDVRAEQPYAFVLNTQAPVRVSQRADVPAQPFTPQTAPVTLFVRGRPLPSWRIGEDNTMEPVPQSPVSAEGEEQELTFVPMGCQRARMSCFPQLVSG